MACGAQRTLEANGLGFRLYQWGAAGGRPALLLHSQAAHSHWQTRIGDTTVNWEPDCFVAPPCHWIEHRNRSGCAPACLFHLNDEPALRALGLWTEETQ